jgi:SAM-dependent methyltransferase
MLHLASGSVGVVEFDHPYLGDVAGRSLLHLQWHYGMDTLSLARLGAIATGIDFSAEAVVAARRPSGESGTPDRFEATELCLTQRTLDGERFDIVYTRVGAIYWLPGIARWGEIVASTLRPGGVFYTRECHPLAWSLRFPIEDPHDETLVVEYPYFEVTDPISWYVDFGDVGSAVIENVRVYEWNHGIGEIMGAPLWVLISRFDNGQGLDHPRGAEVHLVVETHGPARPGYIADQLHGFATEGDVVANLQFADCRGEGRGRRIRDRYRGNG